MDTETKIARYHPKTIDDCESLIARYHPGAIGAGKKGGYTGYTITNAPEGYKYIKSDDLHVFVPDLPLLTLIKEAAKTRLEIVRNQIAEAQRNIAGKFAKDYQQKHFDKTWTENPAYKRECIELWTKALEMDLIEAEYLRQIVELRTE